MANLKTPNIAKNQEFELIASCHFKNPISPKPRWNSQWSIISSRNLKRQHHCPFAHISDFFLKKRFFRKSSKSGHRNLVLITSTVQVELSKLNFNFIDITNIFYIVFQVLKVLLIKYCKIQSLDPSFLVVFISFYISRYHFSQVFRTSFNII